MDPDLLSGGGVERHERAVHGQHVHNVVHDDRIEEVGAVVARGIGPGDL